MTKGRSTKLWITLLDPEIRNGEPRLVQVWRLYKDLPGSGPNWSEPCQLGTDPGKSLQSVTCVVVPTGTNLGNAIQGLDHRSHAAGGHGRGLLGAGAARGGVQLRARGAQQRLLRDRGHPGGHGAHCPSPPRTAATGEPTSATERGLMPSRLRSPRSASPCLSLKPPRRPHLGRARTHEATRRASTRGPEVRLPHPSQAPMSRSQEARAGAAWPFRYSSSPPRG